MQNGEKINEPTEEEKACFKLLDDLDHIGGHVQGSLTSKKYMRNEIWSLMAFKGAPSWFITFSPVDSKHPIALYFADTKTQYYPDLKSVKDKYMLTMANPEAGT